MNFEALSIQMAILLTLVFVKKQTVGDSAGDFPRVVGENKTFWIRTAIKITVENTSRPHEKQLPSVMPEVDLHSHERQ